MVKVKQYSATSTVKFLRNFNSIQFNYLMSRKILLNGVFLFSLEDIIPKTDIAQTTM